MTIGINNLRLVPNQALSDLHRLRTERNLECRGRVFEASFDLKIEAFVYEVNFFSRDYRLKNKS